ncbi:MAG: nitroreductase family protein [Granulosicoccus sp.]
MAEHSGFIELEFTRLPREQMLENSRTFLEKHRSRRSVRDFSPETVDREIIANAILTAGSAPSGANMQPWHFVAVNDPLVKSRIRTAAEKEEHELYAHRASDEWLDALAPLGTDADKPFLETAPWLIAIFAKKFTLNDDGTRLKNYYTPESVGIATGMLIAALHDAGLATLTHTPSPMSFLRDVLKRPAHEKPFLLLVTGYPAPGAKVPDIEKQTAGELMSWW